MHPTLAPRPLHDPMADLAIVLFDPTIDNRVSASQLLEETETAPRRKEEEARRGPHKSLRAILGIVDVKKKEDVKVPVVIDPRLSKILRPHQIEGVKVRSLSKREEILTAVLISMHDRTDGRESPRVHHGRRNGTR